MIHTNVCSEMESMDSLSVFDLNYLAIKKGTYQLPIYSMRDYSQNTRYCIIPWAS
jgi:hypothetical protein